MQYRLFISFSQDVFGGNSLAVASVDNESPIYYHYFTCQQQATAHDVCTCSNYPDLKMNSRPFPFSRTIQSQSAGGTYVAQELRFGHAELSGHLPLVDC